MDIDLDIYCQIEGEDSRSCITNDLSCGSDECINENLMGGTALGPVNAGETYSCRVTVMNNNGSDNRGFSNITVNEGKYRKLYIHCMSKFKVVWADGLLIINGAEYVS